MINEISGHFKGIFHIYKTDSKWNPLQIEEIVFECFENCFTSGIDFLQDEWCNADMNQMILDLPKVKEIKKDEFFIDIYGSVGIEYYRGSYEYPNELSVEAGIDSYHVKEIDELDAMLIGGYITASERKFLERLKKNENSRKSPVGI